MMARAMITVEAMIQGFRPAGYAEPEDARG